VREASIEHDTLWGFEEQRFESAMGERHERFVGREKIFHQAIPASLPFLNSY